ncbi:hypothetical protein QVD99_004169 [Batrachochytrium dendrobatidis]|nr:hypothetical protein QVD99_004169 [Batrachochytrium dendrobatidis]
MQILPKWTDGFNHYHYCPNKVYGFRQRKWKQLLLLSCTSVFLAAAVLLWVRLDYWRLPEWKLQTNASSMPIESLQTDTTMQHRVGPLVWQNGSVPLDLGFAGFMPIQRSNTNASMFYWFFPAQQPLEDNPPLIIWLQGGPGSSSMIGLFYEMGPVRLNNKLELFTNINSWNLHYAMLFIDNPVGTGYSYVGQNSSKVNQNLATTPLATTPINEELIDRAAQLGATHECSHGHKNSKPSDFTASETPQYSDGYACNQEAVSQDLITFLDGFYSMYPKMRKSKLYITGESYAGKYIPHFAIQIDRVNAQRIQSPSTLIPLKGIAIGNGLTDPVTQIKYHAPQGLALGLVSRSQAEVIQRYANAAVGFICRSEWKQSLEMRNLMFSFFQNSTGGINWYDVRKKDEQNDWSRMESFLQLETTKQSLNVGSLAQFGKDQKAAESLTEDIMKSAAHVVAELLDKKYRVVLYQGQFDFRDGIMGSTDWIESMTWTGSKEFLMAPRTVWRMLTERLLDTLHVVGYVTQYRHLARIELLAAGHLAPMDQGYVVRQMIDTHLIKELDVL